MEKWLPPATRPYDGKPAELVTDWLGGSAGPLRLADFNARQVLFETLVQNLDCAVFWKDADLLYRGCNESFALFTGLDSPQEVLGRNDLELFGDSSRARQRRELDRQVLVQGRSTRVNLSFPLENGESLSVRVQIHPLFGTRGTPEGILGIIEDLSELIRTERKVEFAANYDPVTGLATRQTLERRLREEISRSPSRRAQLGLLVLDLHQFKNVNILHGVEVGDRVLRECANRLSCGLRKYDLVARMGEDCFGILISNMKTDEDLGSIAEKILQLLRPPVCTEGREVRLQGMIGISRWSDESADGQDMIQRAFMALDEAARLGPGTYHRFVPEQDGRRSELLRMEERLHSALERGDLSVHYQPQVDGETGAIVGAEALLRWNDACFGAVSPVEFIPLAEASGQIIPIGEWVLRQACTQALAWRRAGIFSGRIWVNLSAKQIQEPFLVQVVRDILAETGLPGSSLGVEITESILVDDLNRATETLEQLGALGVQVAVDDFGTGYSSLNYLKHFPVDVLKIDRCFIRDVFREKNGAMMVKAIITIARALELEVLAEGVEETSQEELLLSLGCRKMQGFKFARPMGAAEFSGYLQAEGQGGAGR